MNVFVCEFCCCRPASDETAQGLRGEGWAMLAAVLHDLNSIPGVAAHTLLAEDFGLAPVACRRIPPTAEEQAFREAAAAADWTLVIAPESDGLLHERCRWVEEAGGKLLGPSAEAVRLVGDKLSLAAHLHARGVPTPPTLPVREALDAAAGLPFPAVCKPRRGAGSQATYLVREEAELCGLANADAIVQPYVPGKPVSAAFLLGLGRCLSLPPAAQHLSDDGRFRYLGGDVPLPPPLAERASRLGRLAVETVPGRRGYVGVDIVLGEDTDGSGDRVIEINARLTTSYVGLRALARGNLAEAMLGVAAGSDAPELCWRKATISWNAAGRVLQ